MLRSIAHHSRFIATHCSGILLLAIEAPEMATKTDAGSLVLKQFVISHFAL
eukprot:SAG11_NODE_35854_length_264_cov_1.260606_1_plen_50_part_10